MATETLSPYPVQKFFGNDGTPLAYGLLTTYAAGSTTPIATYKDSIGTVNTNPIVLNARGECALWISPNVSYKLSLTDSAGNLIPGYPVDNIVNSALLTLYGGVDFGSANAYEITYSAPYTSYTAGNPVIYFIPSNSNTGASTINVNSLGIVPIVNPNGTPLTAGQIVNNQMVQIVWQQGQFILTSVGATAGLNIGTFGAEVSIASAATTDLGSTGTHTVNVTGSSVITSLGTSASINAPIFAVRFSGNPLLTYNATSLITPSGANISCNTGDAMLAEYLGSGNWKILIYQSTLPSVAYAVRTTTSSPVVSNTTPAIDSQLQFPIAQTGTYFVEGWINDLSGTSAGGLKGDVNFSGSSFSALWAMVGTGTGTTNIPLTNMNTAVEFQSAQTGVGSMFITGSLQATSTGTLSFYWSQNSSNGTGSVIGAGSYLQARLVSLQAGSFTPLTYSYNVSGTFSQTIPSGATTVTIEVFGASGGGATNYPNGQGGGGASGGFSRTIATVTGYGGQTIAYTVGLAGSPASSGGTSSVSSGTFSLSTMTANGGGGASGASAGSGGTATGGTSANTTGEAGMVGGVGGIGGAGIVGTYATGYPGGNGYSFPSGGFPGGNGIVVFHFV